MYRVVNEVRAKGTVRTGRLHLQRRLRRCQKEAAILDDAGLVNSRPACRQEPPRTFHRRWPIIQWPLLNKNRNSTSLEMNFRSISCTSSGVARSSKTRADLSGSRISVKSALPRPAHRLQPTTGVRPGQTAALAGRVDRRPVERREHVAMRAVEKFDYARETSSVPCDGRYEELRARSGCGHKQRYMTGYDGSSRPGRCADRRAEVRPSRCREARVARLLDHRRARVSDRMRRPRWLEMTIEQIGTLGSRRTRASD